MNGWSENILYQVPGKTTICSSENVIVPISTNYLMGDRVLHYDPQENEIVVRKCIHLHNNIETSFASGNVSIFDNGRFVSQAQFMPMIPGDDQMIPYGEDSSVEITRSSSPIAEGHKLKEVKLIRDENSITIGCELIHKAVIRTKYSIQNNSTQRSVPKLYIDHTACSKYGGFVITTTDKCIKDVTGFSRYEFTLAPLESVEFVVMEEAVYSTPKRTKLDLMEFVNNQAKALIKTGIIDNDFLTEITNTLLRIELKDMLRKIASGAFNSSHLLKRRERYKVDLNKSIVSGLESSAKLHCEIEQKERLISIEKEGIAKIQSIQQRIRENIKGLESVSEKCVQSLLSRYLKDLNQQEDQMHEANKNIDKLSESIFDSKKLVAVVEAKCSSLARDDLAELPH
jgi:hypothetical protein